MMLIPQHPGLGTVESLKTPYFVDPTNSPPSVVASVSTVGHGGGNGAPAVFSYSTGDGCLIPGRMQSELPGLNMYGPQPGSSALASPTNYGAVPPAVAAAPALMTPHYPGAGIEHSPYYPSLGSGYEMKPGGGEMWAGGYPQPPPGYYPYENTFGPQYPYDRYCSMDMNDGVRRKNATRESTNTLKAWLQEHKKNPYPTKGEKIMLAIITKMTLTQVSTWFANARRRLKKENKMTWVPKNRSNENSSGSSEKKEDGDDDDSQNLDADNRSDNDPGADSDDSAEREVTSTNNNELGSNYSQENAPFEEPNRVPESYNSDPAHADKPHHPFPTTGETEYKPTPNMPCDGAQGRFGHAEGPNRAIWSPVNEHARVTYPLHQQDRLDIGRDQDNSYANSATSGQFPDGFANPAPGLGRQGSIVSPGLIRDGEAVARAVGDYHYPSAHQPWSTEQGFAGSLPSSSEACSIGHSASGGESTEGQEMSAVGSPNSADYQRQYACGEVYPRGSEHYLPMYPMGRAREMPGSSPVGGAGVRSIEQTPPYQASVYAQNSEFYQQRDRLPPPPPLGVPVPYYSREHSTSIFTHGDPAGTPLDATASPTAGAISPPNSRGLFHAHRPGGVSSGPYYGQAPSASPMYHNAYYPQDGTGHMTINSNHVTSIVDVTNKLSPSVNQSAYARSPGSKSPAVEIGTSPNGRCDVQGDISNHTAR